MEMKTEYPRPQFVRKEWKNLNGTWEFAFDDNDRGIREKWYGKGKSLEKKINVPFVYQSELSGIGDRTPHDIVWYKKSLELEQRKGYRTILHFGAVDYEAKLYINGEPAGEHSGGYTPVSIDITPDISGKEQEGVLRVYDPGTDEGSHMGKQ